MNTVIFDPEDLEPITVINVPPQFIREIEQGVRPPYLRFACHIQPHYLTDEIIMEGPKIAEVRFEPLVYGDLRKWMAFAMNPEICLLLKSVFLPGQSAAIQDERKQAMAKGFLKGLSLAVKHY